jgi:hypothetical protein
MPLVQLRPYERGDVDVVDEDPATAAEDPETRRPEMSLPVIRTPVNVQSRKRAPARSTSRNAAPRKSSVEEYSAATNRVSPAHVGS